MTKPDRHAQLLDTLAAVLNTAQLLLRELTPESAEPSVSGDDGGRRGRPREVAKAIFSYLVTHPNSHHADILAAMEEMGFSAAAVNDNLRVLRQLGLVVQAAKGQPYRAVPLD
jgi:hypothetical protein